MNKQIKIFADRQIKYFMDTVFFLPLYRPGSVSPFKLFCFDSSIQRAITTEENGKVHEEEYIKTKTKLDVDMTIGTHMTSVRTTSRTSFPPAGKRVTHFLALTEKLRCPGVTVCLLTVHTRKH